MFLQSPAYVAKTLEALLALNASANVYMAHGGTNFAFESGAGGGGTNYKPVTTSYDYDAPISEAGKFLFRGLL